MTRGQIFVISGPPGAGKSSLVKMLLAEVDNLSYSISLTTRAPRPDEQHGKDYFFVSRTDFEQRILNNEMLEYVEVFDNLYGTSAKQLNDMLNAGKDVLLDIEVKGVNRVRQLMNDGVFVFLLPPDPQTLRARLRQRGTESQEVIDSRLRRLQYELSQIEENYNYLVINRDLSEAFNQIKSIIQAQRQTVPRQWPGLKPLWT